MAYDIAGTVESIAAITDDLHENFDVFYHPSNMNLFVIGNFDLEAVWKQISSYQVAQMDNPAQSFELAGVQKLPIQEHLSEQFEVSTPKLAVGLREMTRLIRRLFRNIGSVYNFICHVVWLDFKTIPTVIRAGKN